MGWNSIKFKGDLSWWYLQQLAVTLIFSTIYVSTSYAKRSDEIIVFGDSVSDTGNLYYASNMTFPESPPYAMGRFSNGLIWIEYLALKMNLTAPIPSNIGGTNYSWGGAETGDGLSSRMTPNIGEQVNPIPPFLRVDLYYSFIHRIKKIKERIEKAILY